MDAPSSRSRRRPSNESITSSDQQPDHIDAERARKVLQPNNFTDLDTLERTLLQFGRHYEQIAQPFEWKFTRNDLHKLLERLDQPAPTLQLAA